MGVRGKEVDDMVNDAAIMSCPFLCIFNPTYFFLLLNDDSAIRRLNLVFEGDVSWMSSSRTFNSGLPICHMYRAFQ